MSPAGFFFSRCARYLVCAVSLFVLWPRGASAQVDQMPEPGYYAAVNEFYAGEYRDAERAFRRMTRSGLQAGQARWIDSICYHAMLGEVLYQQGRNAEALQSFDQACLLFLSYPDFMTQVKFEDPRPEPNPSRQGAWRTTRPTGPRAACGCNGSATRS